MSENTTTSEVTRFDKGRRVYHWAAAVLVLLMILGGFTMSRETATIHFGVGIVVLALMVLWLAWKAGHPRPDLLPMPRWQQILAKSVHHLLMLTVTLQPIFGLMMISFHEKSINAFWVIPLKIVQNDTLNGIGHEAHEINAFVICGLLALHIAGALYHHFIARDATLTRMKSGTPA